MLERDYQAKLVKKIKKLYPECVVLKTDPNYIQGFPDLLILHGNTWASLETKRSESSSRRPNQDYYVEKLDGMSFAAFIRPENEEVVLNELSKAFGA